VRISVIVIVALTLLGCERQSARTRDKLRAVNLGDEKAAILESVGQPERVSTFDFGGRRFERWQYQSGALESEPPHVTFDADGRAVMIAIDDHEQRGSLRR
jgi:hypothetical protein